MNLGTMIIRIYLTDYLNTDISDDCLKMEFYPPIQRHTVVRNRIQIHTTYVYMCKDTAL